MGKESKSRYSLELPTETMHAINSSGKQNLAKALRLAQAFQRKKYESATIKLIMELVFEELVFKECGHFKSLRNWSLRNHTAFLDP